MGRPSLTSYTQTVNLGVVKGMERNEKRQGNEGMGGVWLWRRELGNRRWKSKHIVADRTESESSVILLTDIINMLGTQTHTPTSCTCTTHAHVNTKTNGPIRPWYCMLADPKTPLMVSKATKLVDPAGWSERMGQIQSQWNPMCSLKMRVTLTITHFCQQLVYSIWG